MYMERFGLRVFCLRIGAVRDERRPDHSGHLAADRPRRRREAEPAARRLAEPARLRRADRRVPRGQDVDWAVVYGISANERRFWDLTHARELLGWEPQDAAPV